MLSQLKDWMETHPGWEVLSDSEDSGDDSQDDDGELYDYVDYVTLCRPTIAAANTAAPPENSC